MITKLPYVRNEDIKNFKILAAFREGYILSKQKHSFINDISISFSLQEIERLLITLSYHPKLVDKFLEALSRRN